MNSNSAEAYIVSRVQVIAQDVRIAKNYILAHFSSSPRKMIDDLLVRQDARKPKSIVIHDSVDVEAQLDQVVNAFKWRMAFTEALWGLIGLGIVLPASGDFETLRAQQDWTTVVPGGGGESAGWQFAGFSVSFPVEVQIAPSLQRKTIQPLSDADLFLADLQIQNLHPEVEDALRQAVICLRHELYLPCIAMLGTASEGAWIEMGLSLLKTKTATSSLHSKLNKYSSDLKSPYVSTLQKMETIMKLYEREDIFSEVITKSGQSKRQLELAFNWSNVIRDGRNAIHYGASSASPNTYEKVAVLLMGVSPHLKAIYAVYDAATSLA